MPETQLGSTQAVWKILKLILIATVAKRRNLSGALHNTELYILERGACVSGIFKRSFSTAPFQRHFLNSTCQYIYSTYLDMVRFIKIYLGPAGQPTNELFLATINIVMCTADDDIPFSY